MTREIKVLDGTTLQPISSAKATFFHGKNNAELKFYDKEGKLYNPSGNKSDSQGIMIVEEPMGHLGAGC